MLSRVEDSRRRLPDVADVVDDVVEDNGVGASVVDVVDVGIGGAVVTGGSGRLSIFDFFLTHCCCLSLSNGNATV